MKSLSDALPELVRTIERRIQVRTFGRIRDLQVMLLGSSIVIRGVVPSYYTKQLALHGALDAIPEAPIVNEIEVA